MGEGWPVHRGMVSSLPGLYLLGDSSLSSPRCDDWKLPNAPLTGGQNYPSVGNFWLKHKWWLEKKGRSGEKQLKNAKRSWKCHHRWRVKKMWPIHIILFSLKQGRNPDACFNVSGPWRHYVWWNKPVRKAQGLCDFTCIRSLVKVKVKFLSRVWLCASP